jgi:hypothetical protein
VDRDTWDLAQTVAAGHGSSRDGDELNAQPASVRFYPYRAGSAGGSASGR